MLYFTPEVFRRLANKNRGHIHVMLEYLFSRLRSARSLLSLYHLFH